MDICRRNEREFFFFFFFFCQLSACPREREAERLKRRTRLDSKDNESIDPKEDTGPAECA